MNIFRNISIGKVDDFHLIRAPNDEEVAYSTNLSSFKQLADSADMSQVKRAFNVKTSDIPYDESNRMENEFNSNVERTEEYQYLNWIFGGFESPEASLELFNPESKKCSFTLPRSSEPPSRHLETHACFYHRGGWKVPQIHCAQATFAVPRLPQNSEGAQNRQGMTIPKRINIFPRTSTFQLS